MTSGRDSKCDVYEEINLKGWYEIANMI